MSLSKREKFTNSDIDSSEDIAVIEVADYTALWIEFLVGVANLTAFTIEYKLTGNGDYLPMASASGDYTTPNFPITKASGNLAAAAFGATVHWARMDVRGVHTVRIKAAGVSSTITMYASKG